MVRFWAKTGYEDRWTGGACLNSDQTEDIMLGQGSRIFRGGRHLGATLVFATTLALMGCSSSGSSEGNASASPNEAGSDVLVVVVNESGQRYELSYVFGRSTPRRVGSIRSGEEIEVRVQPRPGDLRFILDDSGTRTFTSNGAQNVREGETYRLLISNTGNPELRLMTER